MRLKIAAALALALFFCGCVYLPTPEKMDPPPKITQAFSAKEVRPGDLWKVYLSASDPSGKMKSIVARLEASGLAGFPVSITRIKKGNEKELSGYIYFETSSAGEALNFRVLTLTLQIQDSADQLSEPVIVTTSFNTQAVRENPPPGVFKENDLGPIMTRITLPGRS